MNRIIDAIEKDQFKTELPAFRVGDSVRVHTRVVEGDKERIQTFAGIVIGRKGRGLNETFTVRRISYGEGVERVFPMHSPRITKVEVEKEGRVRRAKLNYRRARRPGSGGGGDSPGKIPAPEIKRLETAAAGVASGNLRRADLARRYLLERCGRRFGRDRSNQYLARDASGDAVRPRSSDRDT